MYSCQSWRFGAGVRAQVHAARTEPHEVALLKRSPFRSISHLLTASAEMKRVHSQLIRREVEVARIQLAARRFIKDEEGAALAEYGILVAFIAIVAITAVTFFGSKISAKFSTIANSF